MVFTLICMVVSETHHVRTISRKGMVQVHQETHAYLNCQYTREPPTLDPEIEAL